MKQITNGPKLYEQVVARIMDSISLGQYRKGDMLPSEKELMDLTGVSRVTVREALRILTESGVIEKRKGKGSFVLIEQEKLMESAFVQDYKRSFLASTEIRMWLEPEIARDLAQKATPEDLAKLRQTLTCGEAQTDTGLNDFHRCMYELTDNPILLRLFDELLVHEEPPEVMEINNPTRRSRIGRDLLEQHRKICSAIEEHNVDFAYFYAKEHLEYVRSIYLDYFSTFYRM